jgi:uncharacterized protein YdeI (YjbR/CyaY-like superfamily)
MSREEDPMATKDPRVDAYIARSADFAKPILAHLRKVVHAGCPGVEETLKWGFPHFMYKGILCSMASFKGHCAFGFWKEALLRDRHKALARDVEPAMGQFGRIAAVSDLPAESLLLGLVKEAAALNDRGVKRPAGRKPERDRTLVVPDYFMDTLRTSKKALATFEGFSNSNRRDYVEWITGAKGEETRKRRLDTAVAWMAEGKVRNWKYIRK